MRRTRFKRRRQLWLPAYGTGGSTLEGITTGTALGGQMELSNTGSSPGGIDWLASPLTFDTQLDPENVQQNITLGAFPPSLRDLVSGSEWSLRRVVGKVFATVSAASGSVNDRFPAVEVGAGIIVCNTDEDGGPTTDFNEVNPLTQQAAEDPWVWMRHWLFGTYGPQPDADPLTRDQAAGQLPMNNMRYGSVADGPHVDQKTMRRIHRDQRLFFVVATRPNRLSDAGSDFDTANISVYFRYIFRFLGNIRSSSGNRGMAAR